MPSFHCLFLPYLLAVEKLIEEDYLPGTGVMMLGLVPAGQVQWGLFDMVDRAKTDRLMKVLDDVNDGLGRVMGGGDTQRLSQSSASAKYPGRVRVGAVCSGL